MNVIKKIKGLINGVVGFCSRKVFFAKPPLIKQNFPELHSMFRYTETAIELKGHQIKIPDSSSFLFMYKEIFEERIYHFNTSNSKPVIIDGGANIGLASIYLKLLYPSSKILAFEPDPYIFSFLKNNTESFGFQNIELIQKGLWNNNTSLKFQTEGADAGLIATLNKTTSALVKEIEVVSLKPFLKNRVDFLKLDIEGAETIVLSDIKDELINVERIFIEYHSFVDQPQTLNEIINILTDANFRLHILSPGLSSKAPFVKINTYSNMDMQLNIFGYKGKTK